MLNLLRCVYQLAACAHGVVLLTYTCMQMLQSCLDDWMLWTLNSQRRSLTLATVHRNWRVRAAWKALRHHSRLHSLADVVLQVFRLRSVRHAWHQWLCVVAVRREIDRARREAAVAAERARTRNLALQKKADDFFLRLGFLQL
jgi:hypothetical protein